MTIRILLLSALLGVAACGGETPTAASSTPTSVAPARNGLTRVEDPSLVCMVNNQMMGKPQIPVEVEGRTYFGCCAMCKDRLTNDPAARQATDPVTGEVVDKATAVIAQDDEGAVYYFASADHVARFTPP